MGEPLPSLTSRPLSRPASALLSAAGDVFEDVAKDVAKDVGDVLGKAFTPVGKAIGALDIPTPNVNIGVSDTVYAGIRARNAVSAARGVESYYASMEAQTARDQAKNAASAARSVEAAYDAGGMVVRELNRPDKGQIINIEAGGLSQKQVNEIADQLPQGVFDALDGQDLSNYSVRTKEFNFKTDEYSYKRSEGQDIINIGNQIGTGLVPPSKEFPAASSLTHAKTNTIYGQALSKNNNLITSGAVNAGITQVISTSIHERGHQGGARGGSTTGHTNLYRKVNEIMNSVGSSSRTPDCSVRGAC